MNRRGFLGSILAACSAPAIVRAQSLMRGSGIIVSSLSSEGLITASLFAREGLEILRPSLVFGPDSFALSMVPPVSPVVGTYPVVRIQTMPRYRVVRL